jgi:hypothetical protein
VYESYNGLIHRSRVSEGVPTWACRLIREESFTRDELIDLKQIMTDNEAPTTELSFEILGGRPTIAWLNSILSGSKV